MKQPLHFYHYPARETRKQQRAFIIFTVSCAAFLAAWAGWHFTK